MWDLTIRNVDFYHLISWFLIYSFLGWVWESCYVSAKKGEWVNRGFINGPLCTIYGCGAVSVYLILKPVGQNLLLLFFGGIVVATALEYVTAVLMESIFHTSWWDYSDKKYNFQGRICLGASLGWGFFTVGLFRILHPVVEGFVALYPVYVGKTAIYVISAVYTADFCVSAAGAFHLRERIPVWEQMADQFQGELLLKVHEKMGLLAEARGISVSSLKGHLEEHLGEIDLSMLKELEEKRSLLMKEASRELQKRKEAMAGKMGYTARRFVKSYPHLNRGYRIRKESRLKKDNKGTH